MRFETPILFLVFNRPNTTKRVFDVIKELKPANLYIAADGPREDNEEDKRLCQEVRFILGNVDWPCRLQTLYRTGNLGCKKAVSQAITWFFEHEDEGIIIEDDCLPDRSFFSYCAELLEKYRNDTRVMQICGSNYLKEFSQGEDSYFFSNYGPIWGWATWKRFWKLYDADILSWTLVKELELHYSIAQSDEEAELRYNLFENLFNNKIDTWDFQVVYARMLNSGLAIIPSKNLVSNIGFGLDANHTTTEHGLSNLLVQNMKFPLTHPRFVVRNYRFDELYVEKFILPKRHKRVKLSFRGKLVNKVKRMLSSFHGGLGFY